MKTMSITEFWKSLDPINRDALRDELSKALFITTTTVNLYGYGQRNVPIQKRVTLGSIIKRRCQVNITF